MVDKTAAKSEQQFLIQRIYLKDFSFEAPMGAKAFTLKVQPSVNQELATEIKRIDNLYEVVLKLTVTAKLKEETVFLVEAHQAGLFLMKGIEGADLTQVLNTVCPEVLFPYSREVIDSALVRGGFPPVMLPPVNFEALFARVMEEGKAQAH